MYISVRQSSDKLWRRPTTYMFLPAQR